MTTLRSGSATHVGQVRSNNQDSFLLLPDHDLYGVADGMGGHAGGEVASAMAVEKLSDHAGEATLENLKEAARVGNRAIFEKAGNDVELHGMGTTLCALQVVPGPEGDELAWINVGDSRVYLFRDDNLIQLSRDHSLVEDLLRDGQLTADEAAVHPKRNIITRALGIDVDVDVDGSTVIPFNGDRYILCSDGLFGEVSEDVISSVLRRLEDPDDAADELVRLANEAGGRDNITVVIVEVVDDDGRAAAASAALAASASTLESRDEPDSQTDATDPEGSAVDPEASTEVVEKPETIDPAEYVPVFADRRSSLPDPDEELESATGDPYADMDGQRSRRITWRVLMFVVALLAVGAVVVGAIVFSARNTYYVGFEDENVAIYKGKPNGVLWIDPELSRETSITRDELPEDVRVTIDDNLQFGSESAATNFIVNLQSIVSDANPTTTTTAPTTTTTTAPTTTAPPAPPTTAAP